MKILKDISLLATGALITFVVIIGINLNTRVRICEQNIQGIAQFIQKAQQPQAKTIEEVK